jgi:nucleoside-diphosphate-sugar epimerase
MLGRRLPVAPTGLASGLAAGVALGARAARRPTEVNAAAARYLARTGTYSIARAREVLGYAPRYDLRQGMERTEWWLREQGMISRTGAP